MSMFEFALSIVDGVCLVIGGLEAWTLAAHVCKSADQIKRIRLNRYRFLCLMMLAFVARHLFS